MNIALEERIKNKRAEWPRSHCCAFPRFQQGFFARHPTMFLFKHLSRERCRFLENAESTNYHRRQTYLLGQKNTHFAGKNPKFRTEF